MKTWETEAGKYLSRFEQLVALLEMEPPRPAGLPSGLLADQLTPLESVIRRAVIFYEIGLWARTRETTASILCLWKEGYLAASASLVRLLFELWAASEYQTAALSRFENDRDYERVARIVDRLFEGVRDEVLMPRGQPASQTSIHVLDTIRHLSNVFPEAESTYDQLCESSHANQPRFFEWWLTGRLGDNWTNTQVQERGHNLLEQTVTVAETSVHGIVASVSAGLEKCGKLYEPT